MSLVELAKTVNLVMVAQSVLLFMLYSFGRQWLPATYWLGSALLLLAVLLMSR